MAINKLILGDCLEVLKTLESESIDLIYIDPPFFSNRTYEVIWGDKGEVRSFEDRFSGGIEHYIAWLKDRVFEMHRILKPTGSIFIHCDSHANAYIRVFILDKIFGHNNYVNEIVWYYYNKFQGNINKLAANHDIIYRYSKSKKFTFTKIREKRDEKVKQIKRVWDKETSKIVNAKDENGKVQYIETDERTIDDVWRLSMLQPADKKERIGYPTQKPETILERIIKMASNEGDTVLDCFVGGGTTVAVADRLNRNWIGIDQSVQAIKVTEFRLNVQQGKVVGKTKDIFAEPFSVTLHKYDYDTLRYQNAFEFETWIVQQFGGLSNSKQRGDLGLDGKTRDNQPIQVKRSDNVGRNVIDNFFSAVQRFDKASFGKNKADNKPVGYVIAFSFGKGAIQEVARLKVEEHVIIELVTVESIVPIAKKPTLKVEIKDLGVQKELREIEFLATGASDSGIEFYAWQFDYKGNFTPDILLDKQGKQTYKFKAGEHQIAVKVVDNQGLESLEVVKLKINGGVKVH